MKNISPRHLLFPLYLAGILLFLFTLSFCNLYSDTVVEDIPKRDISEKLVWFSLGFGKGTFQGGSVGDTEHNGYSKNALCGILSGSYYNKSYPFFHTIRQASLMSLDLFDNMPESVNDFGYLIGIIAKGRFAYLSASGGLSYVSGRYRGEIIEENMFGTDYKEKKFKTVGVPLQAELFLTPFTWLGIGCIAFYNINYIRPFMGINACAQLIL
ncbi:MAG: hypothetical protein EPN93_15385 [Spirochaetes bacterium]|nr:MAG: hypothetical protein EPN93_15385 [Spirochaetota bacterium]